MADEEVRGLGAGTMEWANDFKMNDSSSNDILRADLNPGGASMGVGSSPVSTVVAKETCIGGIHQTVLTLTSALVPCVSVTTGAGVGGLKLYDMPAGYVRILGCTADITDLSIATAKQADYTDGTPQGDIGVGTVIMANADAMGTDATDDDLATATALTMAAFAVDVGGLAPEAAQNLDGTSTAVDVNLNVLIDAADVDDDTTTETEATGTVTVTWINLGDF